MDQRSARPHLPPLYRLFFQYVPGQSACPVTTSRHRRIPSHTCSGSPAGLEATRPLDAEWPGAIHDEYGLSTTSRRPRRREGQRCDPPKVNTRPAPAATTPNYGGATRYCGGPLASSLTTTPSTSAVELGRQPDRPHARPRQAVRSGSTSPRPRSSAPPGNVGSVSCGARSAALGKFSPHGRNRLDLARKPELAGRVEPCCPPSPRRINHLRHRQPTE
jgi:hypothetical protein